MKFKYYNPNPHKKMVGDCVIRAISMALGMTWVDVYKELAKYGIEHGDIMTSNSLWGSFLREHGFKVKTLPNDCPDCYSIYDFALEHPFGTYVLCTGTHAVCLYDGWLYDIWDCREEIISFYYERTVKI